MPMVFLDKTAVALQNPSLIATARWPNRFRLWAWRRWPRAA